MFAGAFLIMMMIAMFSGCQPAVEPRGQSSGRIGARSQTRPPPTLSSGAQQVSSLQGAEERRCCSYPGRYPKAISCFSLLFALSDFNPDVNDFPFHSYNLSLSFRTCFHKSPAQCPYYPCCTPPHPKAAPTLSQWR